MTTSFEEKAKKTLFWIIGINAGVFVLQNILNLSGGGSFMSAYFALHSDSLSHGFIWTPLTYSFLHSTSNFFHILGNMLGVFLLGRSILPITGQVRFLQLYLGAALTGGILWYLASFMSGSPSVVGASGAVCGLLAFICVLYWDREIELLLFFALPVRIKPKYIIYGFGGLTLLGFIFQELLGSGRGSIAHSAHLGGMIFGYIFYRFVYQRNPYYKDSPLSVPLAGLFKRNKGKKSAPAFKYKVNVSSEPLDLKVEVDRILDKINSKGFGSLSDNEKRILDEARDLLRKR